MPALVSVMWSNNKCTIIFSVDRQVRVAQWAGWGDTIACQRDRGALQHLQRVSFTNTSSSRFRKALKHGEVDCEGTNTEVVFASQC